MGVLARMKARKNLPLDSRRFIFMIVTTESLLAYNFCPPQDVDYQHLDLLWGDEINEINRLSPLTRKIIAGALRKIREKEKCV